MPQKHAKPHVKTLAHVHSRVHFCREGAVIRLKNGLNRLVCREGLREGSSSYYDGYDLWLGEELLAEADLARISTLGARLRAGYGDGLMQEAECLAAEERVNEAFEGLDTGVQRIAPLLGLLASGLYLVADCELQPVLKRGNYREHCLNMPLFNEELKFSAGSENWDAPFYPVPTQRAALLEPERIRFYMEWMERSDYRCPRAIALYLNGGVCLLLDGHHKAAAAAALGRGLRTLVIFPVQNEKALEAAVRKGEKLELCHGRWSIPENRRETSGIPMYLGDDGCVPITHIRGLTHAAAGKMPEAGRKTSPWGRVPEEFCTKLDGYPDARVLMNGTSLPPDRIKSAIRQVMDTPWPLPREPWEDMDPKCGDWLVLIRALRDFAALFPHSSMLTEDQRRWLTMANEEADRVL